MLLNVALPASNQWLWIIESNQLGPAARRVGRQKGPIKACGNSDCKGVGAWGNYGNCTTFAGNIGQSSHSTAGGGTVISAWRIVTNCCRISCFVLSNTATGLPQRSTELTDSNKERAYAKQNDSGRASLFYSPRRWRRFACTTTRGSF